MTCATASRWGISACMRTRNNKYARELVARALRFSRRTGLSIASLGRLCGRSPNFVDTVRRGSDVHATLYVELRAFMHAWDEAWGEHEITLLVEEIEELEADEPEPMGVDEEIRALL